MTAKYSIGIDLGTTNSVLAYARLDQDQPKIEILSIPQVIAPGQVESRQQLPSFLFLCDADEAQQKALEVPGWLSEAGVVGSYARSASAEQPERTVASAKSWLCNTHVDRQSNILPWDSGDDVLKISPVNASTAYLKHLIATWSEQFPDAPIDAQQVVLTVPASFDMAARELTRQAALQAGFPSDFILLEEPQAAVYHWIHATGDGWRKQVRAGDSMLVCDVGGGTTDLTLVRAEDIDGELTLHRLAVGSHLLVGGDNMDLALAHFAAQRFAQLGHKLNPWQSVSLWHSCRAAKETLMSGSERDTYTLSILGRGTRLIGGTISLELTRAEVEQVLIDGFFPVCEKTDRPRRDPASGFLQLGLPFESETAVTRHVAAFLADHQPMLAGLPNNLLFNGGVFRSKALRDRMVQSIEHWSEGKNPQVLGGTDDLDQAVASGAAFYGWSKQIGGLRIRGGTARSYYVGIETSGLAVPGMPRPLQALCVVPFGMEEGTEASVPGREVGVIVGQPARFRFFASSIRTEDQVGATLRHWDEEELVETVPMEVTLPKATNEETFVPVRFESKITELGVFELWCHSTRDDRRWKLEFNVREEVAN